MSDSQAVAGVGTLLRRWNGSAWVNIAEVLNIGGPSFSRDVFEVTSLDATDLYRVFKAGFRDSGEVTFSMNFRRDEFDTLKSDFENNDNQNYEIVLPDDENTTLEFEGLVTNAPLTIPPDAQITVDVTIKISGKTEVESGSGSS